MNRAVKRKKVEPATTEKEKENVNPEINNDVKPKIHKLHPSAKKSTKYTRKHEGNVMTKEAIASLLTQEDDEIDLALSSYAKRI